MFAHSNKKTHRCDPVRNKKLQNWQLLTPQQQQAIDLFLSGLNQPKIASAVGFRREAINRWFSKDLKVIAALEERKQQLFTEVLRRDKSLIETFELIETALLSLEILENRQLLEVIDLLQLTLIRTLIFKNKAVEGLDSSKNESNLIKLDQRKYINIQQDEIPHPPAS